MSYDFVKPDGMLCEFKIYNTKIDFEKLFNELPKDVKKDILCLTELHYLFFREELRIENTTSMSINLNSVKKIDKIPIKAYISLSKNYKYINILDGNYSETSKISIVICLPSYEYVSCNFEMLQSIYLIDFDLEDEYVFKKYLYNILFYSYIIIKDFQYHPMLKYLNYKDDIENLLNIKNSFIRLYGEINECSVCLENTTTFTICNHYLCQKCFSQLNDKVCPTCRADLLDENTYGYEDINMDLLN